MWHLQEGDGQGGGDVFGEVAQGQNKNGGCLKEGYGKRRGRVHILLLFQFNVWNLICTFLKTRFQSDLTLFPIRSISADLFLAVSLVINVVCFTNVNWRYFVSKELGNLVVSNCCRKILEKSVLQIDIIITLLSFRLLRSRIGTKECFMFPIHLFAVFCVKIVSG